VLSASNDSRTKAPARSAQTLSSFDSSLPAGIDAPAHVRTVGQPAFAHLNASGHHPTTMLSNVTNLSPLSTRARDADLSRSKNHAHRLALLAAQEQQGLVHAREVWPISEHAIAWRQATYAFGSAPCLTLDRNQIFCRSIDRLPPASLAQARNHAADQAKKALSRCLSAKRAVESGCHRLGCRSGVMARASSSHRGRLDAFLIPSPCSPSRQIGVADDGGRSHNHAHHELFVNLFRVTRRSRPSVDKTSADLSRNGACSSWSWWSTRPAIRFTEPLRMKATDSWESLLRCCKTRKRDISSTATRPEALCSLLGNLRGVPKARVCMLDAALTEQCKFVSIIQSPMAHVNIAYQNRWMVLLLRTWWTFL